MKKDWVGMLRRIVRMKGKDFRVEISRTADERAYPWYVHIWKEGISNILYSPMYFYEDTPREAVLRAVAYYAVCEMLLHIEYKEDLEKDGVYEELVLALEARGA